MFKLLSPEQEKRIIREYTMRRLALALGALTIVLSIGVGGLVPSYILARARKAEVVERGKILDAAGIKGDDENLGDWLVAMNKKLSILDPKLDTDRPSEVIGEIINEKDKNIKLLAFNWSRSKDVVKITLNGFSANRQTLIDFQDRVVKSGNFTNVSLPVSNLARDKDIDFEMSLSPKTP